VGFERIESKLSYSSIEVGYFYGKFGRASSCVWILGKSWNFVGKVESKIVGSSCFCIDGYFGWKCVLLESHEDLLCRSS
jgi:hypothetical protein